MGVPLNPSGQTWAALADSCHDALQTPGLDPWDRELLEDCYDAACRRAGQTVRPRLRLVYGGDACGPLQAEG